jgi:glycosyltransferase involved in cell wall biosynthesis
LRRSGRGRRRMADRPAELLLLSITLNKGGAERFASTLLVHLDRAEVKPSLCLLRKDVGYPLPDDVPYGVLEYHRPAHLFRAVRRLRGLLAELQPDVVISNGAATGIVAGMALRRCRADPAWIARIDNNPRYHDTGLRKFILKRVYRRADGFVVNSRGMLGDLAACYPFAKKKAQALWNPTDFARIDRLAEQPPVQRADSGVPVVISVGRLFPQKRLDLLVDAFARVRQQQKAELWICGDGPERRRIESKVAHLTLGPFVRILGHCPNPHALMRQAAVYALSSDYEGLPNALIEAQGLGLPAVSTRCPHGPDEIVDDGKTGLLTPVGDVRALADALLKLLSNQPRCRQMGQLARLHARRLFDAPHLVRGWEQAILQYRHGRGSR